ncbi:uncharacterized protein LOC144274446 [Eretmochelys imbricata]
MKQAGGRTACTSGRSGRTLCFCHQSQRPVPVFLHVPGPQPGLARGHVCDPVEGGLDVCLPPAPLGAQGPTQGAQGQGGGDPHRPSLSPPALVHITPRAVGGSPSSPAPTPGPYYTGRRAASPPRPTVTAPDGVEALWLNALESQCSLPVQQILLGSRKPSTRVAYMAKWKRFSCWCEPWQVRPCQAPVQAILEYLLHLKRRGLAPSSLRVYLAAISAFHPGFSGGSVFSHPMVGWFLKGLERMFPYSHPPVPPWNLNLVLSKLMGPPFEPLASCSLLHLSWKVAFLVAITSARRVSRLRALTSEPLYTVFHKDMVQLRPHPKFLPKVVSQFHLGQDICLPVFFPKLHTDSSHRSLHTLDVRRALAFYLERTKPFRKSAQLFVAVAERMKGLPVLAQRISFWITSCIWACYELAGVPVTAHSTRAQATSTAFLAQVPIQEICRAATWSSVHTFMTHYTVNQQAREDVAVGRAVLRAVVP